LHQSRPPCDVLTLKVPPLQVDPSLQKSILEGQSTSHLKNLQKNVNRSERGIPPSYGKGDHVPIVTSIKYLTHSRMPKQMFWRLATSLLSLGRIMFNPCRCLGHVLDLIKTDSIGKGCPLQRLDVMFLASKSGKSLERKVKSFLALMPARIKATSSGGH
jgi:hypothetical protein